MKHLPCRGGALLLTPRSQALEHQHYSLVRLSLRKKGYLAREGKMGRCHILDDRGRASTRARVGTGGTDIGHRTCLDVEPIEVVASLAIE